MNNNQNDVYFDFKIFIIWLINSTVNSTSLIIIQMTHVFQIGLIDVRQLTIDDCQDHKAVTCLNKGSWSLQYRSWDSPPCSSTMAPFGTSALFFNRSLSLSRFSWWILLGTFRASPRQKAGLQDKIKYIEIF